MQWGAPLAWPGEQTAPSWFSGLAVVVDRNLPPDVFVMYGAPGSMVRVRLIGTVRPVEMARWRKTRQALRRRDRRAMRRARRAGA